MDHCYCKSRRGFIQESHFAGSGDRGREQVSICLTCGKIHVVGDRNGEHFDISFHIVLPEQLAAVGKYARLLEQDQRKERTMYHPNPADYNEAVQRAKRWWDENPLFLDTETTGPSDTDEVCEIAIVDLEGRVLLNSLVKPARKTDWAAAAELHGISPEKVLHEPTFRELLPELERILRGRTVLVYNLDFDQGKLFRSLTADGFEPDREGFRLWWYPRETFPGGQYLSDWHCVMQLYAQFYGEWNDYHGNYRWQRLGAAALQCGLQLPAGIHRAHADAELTRQIFLHMAEAELLATEPPEIQETEESNLFNEENANE